MAPKQSYYKMPKAIAISELVYKLSDHVFQTKIQTHHLTIDKIFGI